MSMYIKKKRKISLMQKKNLIGYVFVAPFIVGFILFFLSPFISSIIYTFFDIKNSASSFSMEYIGWGNYRELFLVDVYFGENLLKAVGSVFINTPLIIIFSFMMANILNQQFRGRTLCRVIFFLPVVLASGVMATMNSQTDYMTQYMMGEVSRTGDLNMLASINQVVSQMNLSTGFTSFIVDAASRIYEIVNASGVQILIFLAGLQTVSPSLFEASNIEGATPWENFWKITFPMVSPMILVNMIYTIVDAMAAEREINEVSINVSLSMGATRSWVYFAAIFVIASIALALVSRMVYYENE